MTPEEARKRVQDIRDASGDDEVAHGMEDGLYVDFVRFIASQEGPHAATAREILKTLDLDFARWCA